MESHIGDDWFVLTTHLQWAHVPSGKPDTKVVKSTLYMCMHIFPYLQIVLCQRFPFAVDIKESSLSFFFSYASSVLAMQTCDDTHFPPSLSTI